MTNEQQLLDQVKALYARLHANALKPEDSIQAADVPASNPGLAAKVKRAVLTTSTYVSATAFDKRFSDFRVPYTVFRAFPRGTVVLDVGANWGHSALAMRWQGCQSDILSVEAMRINAPGLDILKRLERGRFDWVNVAVDSREGTLTIYTPMLNGQPLSGLASTGVTLDDYFASIVSKLATTYPPKSRDGSHDFKLIVEQVRSAQIDTLLKERGDISSKVAGMKIDVEGHEVHALQGASQLLSAQKPLLMIEGANRALAVTALLIEHGYFHCELHNGRLVPHLAYSMANDGFFVHPDKAEAYRRHGLFEGVVPSAAEIAVLPIDDGVNGFNRKTAPAAR